MMMKIPLGFHFAPSDEELITSYLLRRAMALPLMPSGYDEHRHILETNLYGEKADPWIVFQDVPNSRWEDISDDEDGKDKRVIFVVTKLTKISKGKTRIARRAGCGTWSGQTPPKKIYDESGQWVGSMRMLSFERAKGEVQYHDPRDQHHWIMHEYSLDGIYNNNSKVDKEYVICRITRLFKGNKYSTNNDIINGTSAQVHEQEQEEDVVHVSPAPCPKKRKREIINTQQLVDQERQLRSRLIIEYPPPPLIIERREKEGESVVSVPVMAADQAGECDDDDEDPADFDQWITSLDDVLLDLPDEPEEEDHNSYSSDDHNNTTTTGLGLSLVPVSSGEKECESVESTLQVESVSLPVQISAQQAEGDEASNLQLVESVVSSMAHDPDFDDWMTLLNNVELPDEEDESDHNNNTTMTGSCFNLDHLDLCMELCF